MKRRAFVKRMAFAAIASGLFHELPRLHAEPAKLFPTRATHYVVDPPYGLTATEALSSLQDLINDIYVNQVLPNVRMETPMMEVFR